MRKRTHTKQAKNQMQGIPSLTLKLSGEKISEVVPVKMQLSLKMAIPEPRSEWVRNLIIKELTK